jgi:nitric oxide reductase NorE protein
MKRSFSPDRTVFGLRVSATLVIFIAVEAMLFGGLFVAYAWLRSGQPDWNEARSALSIARGVINTLWLAMATMLVRAAMREAGHGDVDRTQRGLRLGALGAAMFLISRATEYSTHAAAGMYPSTNTFFSVYYLLTGAHALHVLGGGVVTAYFGIRGLRSTGGDVQRFVDRLHALSLYWVFVDVVWLAILVTFYFL